MPRGRKRKYLDERDRLMRNMEVNDRGCWLWKRFTLPNGYGTYYTSFDGAGLLNYVHRISYEIFNGQIEDGKIVQHLCEKFYDPGDRTCRRCFNPDHLYCGTYAENLAYAAELGRMRRGEGVVTSRLSNSDVTEIKTRLRSGSRVTDLAKEYGVSHPTISDIKRLRTWAWL